MTFSLTVDRHKFDSNARSVIDSIHATGATVTAVIKGNGYGLGRRFLAHESRNLGISRIAVGTVYELAQALNDFDGEVLVLEPFSRLDLEAVGVWTAVIGPNSHRVIATIACDDFALAKRSGITRVLIEGRTSMNRFGVSLNDAPGLFSTNPHGINVVGLTLHFPRRLNASPVQETETWIDMLSRLDSRAGQMEVLLSHVTSDDLGVITSRAGDRFIFGVRVGSSLWLGDPTAFTASGTILEIRRDLERGSGFGYRQRRGRSNKALLVVSGGTSHGVALSAPSAPTGFLSAIRFAVNALTELCGRERSPFRVSGRNARFAEPPHMHQSMLWCDDLNLRAGDKLECVIRKTVATFDEIRFE